jgi:hypothetical protein
MQLGAISWVEVELGCPVELSRQGRLFAWHGKSRTMSIAAGSFVLAYQDAIDYSTIAEADQLVSNSIAFERLQATHSLFQPSLLAITVVVQLTNMDLAALPSARKQASFVDIP